MDRQAFFAHIRKAPFAGALHQWQVDGINTILDVWDEEGGGRRQHLSYCLATTYHETAAAMVPVREGFWLPGGGEAHRKKLRYYPWYGRGDVQLTWEANYRKADEELGLGGSLLKEPDRALEPDLAAKIMFKGMRDGWFAGDKKGRHTLGRYLFPGHTDFNGARRIINGLDRANVVGVYAEHFDVAILAAVLGELK